MLSVAFIAPSAAGLAIRRRTAPKVSSGRRASLRVSAHGGVGGSGGTQYAGRDKPHGSDQAPWRKKLILDDPDQIDPENAGRGQRYTPPPPQQVSTPAAAPPSNSGWVRSLHVCFDGYSPNPIRTNGFSALQLSPLNVIPLSTLPTKKKKNLIQNATPE